MDPISLLVTLFGAAGLTALGIQRQLEISARGTADDVVLRKIFDTSDGWMANEIMSPEALNLTGQIMDVPLLQWWPQVKSGFFRVVTLTQPGAPLDRQIVLLLESAGKYGWYLNQAHHPGLRRVEGRLNYQRISAMLDALNKDPAEEVVKTAAKIMDLRKRYAYLKRALTANPQLSALLSQSEPFLEITRSTVKHVDPATFKEVEEKKARRQSHQMPVRALSQSLAGARAQPVKGNLSDYREPVMRALPVQDEIEFKISQGQRVEHKIPAR